MFALTATALKQNFKDTCDKVYHGENLIIMRPNNQNVVLISENYFAELEKAKRNAEYLEKLDRSVKQLENGEVVHKTMAELRAMEQ